MYLGHPNDIEPRDGDPLADNDDSPEAAGERRKEELDEAALNADGTLNGDMLLQAVQDYQATLRGEDKTNAALIAAVTCAKRMDNTGCARAILRWFDLVKAVAANQAEDERQTEIDREESHDREEVEA